MCIVCANLVGFADPVTNVCTACVVCYLASCSITNKQEQLNAVLYSHSKLHVIKMILVTLKMIGYCDASLPYWSIILQSVSLTTNWLSRLCILIYLQWPYLYNPISLVICLQASGIKFLYYDPSIIITTLPYNHIAS